MADQQQQQWARREEVGRVAKGAITSIRTILLVDEHGRGVAQVRKYKGEDPTTERINIPVVEALTVSAHLIEAFNRFSDGMTPGEEETAREAAE